MNAWEGALAFEIKTDATFNSGAFATELESDLSSSAVDLGVWFSFSFSILWLMRSVDFSK